MPAGLIQAHGSKKGRREMHIDDLQNNVFLVKYYDGDKVEDVWTEDVACKGAMGNEHRI